MSSLPPKSSLDDRLKSFPQAAAPVSAEVIVRWDEHQIPFIEATTDEDLAFGLGVVNAHLRLGQMEMIRRISQGRVAEMVGPFAADADHLLRILNFGKATDGILASMEPATRRWLERYAEGINHYVRNTRQLPHEFESLRMKPEPWTLKDLIVLSRLAAVDVNWLAWAQLLPLRDDPHWSDFWKAYTDIGGASAPSFHATGKLGETLNFLGGLSRSGSNSFAVSASKSATDSAWIASDPHLGILLPNVWLIVGLRSPSYNAVGLMIPGLPFLGLGRNQHIAWGGTNMRALSSALYDVSNEKDFTTREEPIRVRGWFDSTARVRESKYGPVLTDTRLFKKYKGPPLALRWLGHEPSDEFTAFLKVNRARDWAEFRQAFATYAVSSQNMLYADASGNIGQVMAVKLPLLPRETMLSDAILHTDQQWQGFKNALELPAGFNPKEGFLASANNAPSELNPPVGPFMSPNNRIRRLKEVLGGKTKISPDDLKALQRDTHSDDSLKVRDLFASLLENMPLALPTAEETLLREIKNWNGNYDGDSKGAAAFQLVLYHFSKDFFERRFGPRIGAFLLGSDYLIDFILKEFGISQALAQTALMQALPLAARDWATLPTWGEMHRVRLAHPLANVPLIGSKYDFGSYPASGNSETLLKTAANLTNKIHFASYGATARQILDLSDPDHNWFLLLGGQDGWFNSSTFLDQVPLWRRGDYVQVPLKPETIRKMFTRESRLSPR